MTDQERFRELIKKVRENPSEMTLAFFRDHPLEDRIEELTAIAMMIEDGKLFYNTENKHLYKLNQRMH